MHFDFYSSKKNLKLSNTEADDADGWGKLEVVKGNACASLWVIAHFHRSWNQDEVEQPLDAILVTWFANTLVNRQIVATEMVWEKKCQ